MQLLEGEKKEVAFLKSEIQFLKNMIAVMPGNVFWKDNSGNYMGCNNNVAQLFGLNSPDQIVGKQNRDENLLAHHPSILDNILHIERPIVDGIQNEISIEEKGINKNKEPAVYLSKRVPLKDRQGQVTGVLGISFDISELKKNETELKIAKENAEIASRHKSEFISNMSHDIKTPLSGLIGLAELLARKLQNHENLAFAEAIRNAGKELLGLFNSCLETFRGIENNPSPSMETFQLASIIDQVHALYLPAVTIKNLSLDIRVDKQIPACLIGNGMGLYRILLNLVGNAVKFTQAGSLSLHVNLIRHNGDEQKIWVAFTIGDTGIGIPEDKQHLVFERFTRLTPAHQNIFQGHGMGLDITRNIVKSMQGEWYMNSREGTGTKFIVHLPFQIAEVAPVMANEETFSSREIVAKKIMHHQPVILLVDDNITAQIVASSLLSILQCEVEVAGTARDAIERFRQRHFDLIFIDIGLPDIQGDAAATIIRELERKKGNATIRTPIIALTAHSLKEENETYIAAGIDYVINKPLSMKQASDILHAYFIRAR